MLKKIAFVPVTFAALLLAGCVTVNYSEPAPSPPSSVTSEAPSSSPSSSAESFAPGAPADQCLTANLTVSIVDEGSSAGHLHSQVVFTNTGPNCVLEGFPRVQVEKAGVPLGSSSEEESSASGVPVSMSTGGSAFAQLTSINIDSGGGPLGDSCVVDHGSGYLVTPPHSYVPITVDVADVPACVNGTAWMTVGPITTP